MKMHEAEYYWLL